MPTLTRTTATARRFSRSAQGNSSVTLFTTTRVSGKKCVSPTLPSSWQTRKTLSPGDVIGLYDNGNLKIGDTLTEGEELQFRGIPSFSPEIFKEVINRDPFKAKQLEKGLRQLTEEGVAQLFLQHGNRKIIGTVGELQFDVIRFRLEHEYGAKCDFMPLRYFKAFWITPDDKGQYDEFLRRKSSVIAEDKEGHPVFFAESEWMLNVAKENYPGVLFHETSEFKTETSSAS